MASLRDVAREAGVSVATASRVVSGLDNVRSETRERVERAMRDLLYVPPRRRAELLPADAAEGYGAGERPAWCRARLRRARRVRGPRIQRRQRTSRAA